VVRKEFKLARVITKYWVFQLTPIIAFFFLSFFIYLIYIPWIIRGKSHLDIGIVNTDMDATRQMYTQYEYKYVIRKEIIVR